MKTVSLPVSKRIPLPVSKRILKSHPPVGKHFFVLIIFFHKGTFSIIDIDCKIEALRKYMFDVIFLVAGRYLWPIISLTFSMFCHMWGHAWGIFRIATASWLLILTLTPWRFRCCRRARRRASCWRGPKTCSTTCTEVVCDNNKQQN